MNADKSRIIEDVENDSMHKLWGKDSKISKVEVYKWKNPGSKGELRWIEKSELKLDLTYQRELDSKTRVAKISREFDWALFGVLLVSKCDDGYYVVDGGHRLRAANRREDITDIPCIVFNLDDVSDEARVFFEFNVQRKSVNTFDRHKAALKANMEIAQKAESLVKKYGYIFTKGGSRPFQTCAINAIYRMIESDENLADKTFSIMAKVSEGEDIQASELSGLFYIMERNRSIDYFGFPLKNLVDAGIGNIRDAIRRVSLIDGKGGQRVFAKALVDIINKGQIKTKVII